MPKTGPHNSTQTISHHDKGFRELCHTTSNLFFEINSLGMHSFTTFPIFSSRKIKGSTVRHPSEFVEAGTTSFYVHAIKVGFSTHINKKTLRCDPDDAFVAALLSLSLGRK